MWYYLDMSKSPLEQPKSEIDALREETRNRLGHLFDDKEKRHTRISIFVSQLNAIERAGFVFNRDEVVREIQKSLEIQDRETFIAHLMKVLEPFMLLKVTNPKIFETVEREAVTSGDGNTRLSEVLYVNFKHENRADIHLATARELMKEKGIAYLKKEVETGLRKLAEMIKPNDKVKEIWATSWIVAKSPLYLRKLGFTVVGVFPEEETEEEENRPIGEAFMTREDFLARYGVAEKEQS